jgi:hypothetical protein
VPELEAGTEDLGEFEVTLGRIDSALDPAPVGMLETPIGLEPRDEWPLIEVPEHPGRVEDAHEDPETDYRLVLGSVFSGSHEGCLIGSFVGLRNTLPHGVVPDAQAGQICNTKSSSIVPMAQSLIVSFLVFEWPRGLKPAAHQSAKLSWSGYKERFC